MSIGGSRYEADGDQAACPIHPDVAQDPRRQVPTRARSLRNTARLEVSWLMTSEWGVSRHPHSVSRVIGMATGRQGRPCRILPSVVC